MRKKELSFTAKKIKELRMQKGMSQGDVRRVFNDLKLVDDRDRELIISNNSTVANWEQGLNGVSKQYLDGLAHVFNVPISGLLFDADELIKPIKLCLNMYLDKLKGIDFREYIDYSEHEFDFIFSDLNEKKRQIMRKNIEGIFGLVGEFDIDTYFLINDFKFLKTQQSIQFVKNQLKNEAYKHLDVVKASMYEWAKKEEVSQILSFNGDDPFDTYISRKMNQLFYLGKFSSLPIDVTGITRNYIGFLKFMSSCGLGNDGSNNTFYSSLEKDKNGDYFTYTGILIPKFKTYYYHSFKKIILQTKYQLQKNLRDVFQLKEKEDYGKINENLKKIQDRIAHISNRDDEELVKKALHEAYLAEKDNS